MKPYRLLTLLMGVLNAGTAAAYLIKGNTGPIPALLCDVAFITVVLAFYVKWKE